jgi:hypothetical protein
MRPVGCAAELDDSNQVFERLKVDLVEVSDRSGLGDGELPWRGQADGRGAARSLSQDFESILLKLVELSVLGAGTINGSRVGATLGTGRRDSRDAAVITRWLVPTVLMRVSATPKAV